jgi:hypothetical protein
LEREDEAEADTEAAAEGAATDGEVRAGQRGAEEWEWAPRLRRGIVSAPTAAPSCLTDRGYPASRPPAPVAVPR